MMYLYEGVDWDFEILKCVFEVIEDIVFNDFKFDVYLN